MKLGITRHPETNKNANLPGEAEAFSTKGQEQLLQIAKVYRNEGIQAIIHSTQPRAVATAKILAHILGVPVIAEERLQERNFGDWDEWEWPQIAAKFDKLTTEERYTFIPPNGESWQQMEERLHAVLKHLVTLGYNSVAIMTHWGPVRAILPLIHNEPKESTLQLDVANGQMFIEEYVSI